MQTRELFETLKPGDRVEVEHEVKVGLTRWQTTTHGTVVKTQRRRHGMHFRRAKDDKVFTDEVILRREDGELTTVTLDEFTVLKRVH